MANLERKQQKIFAENSQSTQVTAFRTAGGTPLYSKDVEEIQNANFSVGWLEEDNAGNVTPYAEDMNGVFYAFTRNLAYLYQKGIPEWSNSETYYENAMCMYGGVLYQSIANDNTNKQPDTQTSYWQPYASPVGGSITGADNLGTGAGISTGVSNTKIQLKSLVAGSNVTISEGADSITISSTGGGGGGGGSVAWGDISGSISSQLDLATALSQRGTLSGNNTWTGTNTFNSLLPDITQTRSIGSGTQSWLEGYIETLIFTGNDHLTLTSYVYPDNDFLFGFESSGLGDWAILPRTGSGVSSSLGSSSYQWSRGYIKTLESVNDLTAVYTNTAQSRINLKVHDSASNTTTFAYLGKSSSNSGLFPAATDTYYLGSSSYRWKVYASDLYATSFKPTTNNSGSIGDSSYHWSYIYANHISANSNIVVHNSIIPETTETYNLGGVISSTTYRFNSGYFKCATIGATGIVPTSTGSTLGNSTTQWASVYTGGVYANSNTLEVGGNSSSVFYLRPSSTATSNELGSASTPWQRLHLSSGASNGIYFGSDSSHSYVRDVTNNTLVLNATSTVQVQNNGTRNYTFASSSFYPTGSKDLGTTSNYWGKSYISEINIHANSGITTYLTNDGIQFLWKASGTSGSLVSAIGYHTYFMPNDKNTINLGSEDNRWKTIFTNNSVNVSDRRSKEWIEDLDGGLEKLNTIGVKSFKLKNHEEGIVYGFIAQDELERNPELVVVPDNYSEEGDGGELMYMPNNVLFLAVKAIQELSAKVEDLENQLQEIKQ